MGSSTGFGYRHGPDQRYRQDHRYRFRIKYYLTNKLRRAEREAEELDDIDRMSAELPLEFGDYEEEDIQESTTPDFGKYLLPNGMLNVRWLVEVKPNGGFHAECIGRRYEEDDRIKAAYIEAVCLYQREFLESHDYTKIKLMSKIRLGGSNIRSDNGLSEGSLSEGYMTLRELHLRYASESERDDMIKIWDDFGRFLHRNEYKHLRDYGFVFYSPGCFTFELSLLTWTNSDSFQRPVEVVYRAFSDVAAAEVETGKYHEKLEFAVRELGEMLYSEVPEQLRKARNVSRKMKTIDPSGQWFPRGKGGLRKRKMLGPPVRRP